MRLALLVLVLTAPVPALALQATCRFETRCAQTAPCVPDDLVLQLASGPMEMSALLIAPDETAIGEVGLAGNGEAVKAIEAKVKEAGFEGFEDWYDTAQSVMIARMWLTNPPSAEELDASEAEIQKMEGISDEEKQDLLASLAEARDQIETMKPTDENMAAVKPHLDKLEGVLGGTN